MTSATAGSTTRPSKASLNLDIARGKKRVALSELHPNELRALLAEQLDGNDMKDLRGFQELKELLPRRGDERLEVNNAASLTCAGFSQSYPLTLKSHVVRACRGCLSETQTYRRYESDVETSDRDMIRQWGGTAYLHRGSEKLLLMRRLPKEYWRENLLVEVTYRYTKVPNENVWLINDIYAIPVTIPGFCKHFGKRAPDIARDLLWELASIYHRTAEEFESRARVVRSNAQKRERLSDSIA